LSPQRAHWLWATCAPIALVVNRGHTVVMLWLTLLVQNLWSGVTACVLRVTEHGWGGIQDVRFPERVGTRDGRPRRWCGSSCGCCDIAGDGRKGDGRARGPRAGAVRRKQPGGRKNGRPEGADRLSASTRPESPRGVCGTHATRTCCCCFCCTFTARFLGLTKGCVFGRR